MYYIFVGADFLCKINFIYKKIWLFYKTNLCSVDILLKA